MSSDRNIEPSEGGAARTGGEAAAAPLPRGRHKLSREDVLESQRTRLLAAMLACVAEQGYATTTVADVVSAARVSRNAFYELFDDKEACFVAAADDAGRRFLEELYALGGDGDWTEALRRGLRRYLEWWQESPAFAVAYLVELPTAGRRALEQRDAAYVRYARLFEALAALARDHDPDLRPLPPLASRIIVTAITEMLAQEVRAGRGDRLTDLEPHLLRFLLETLADAQTAERVLRTRAAAA